MKKGIQIALLLFLPLSYYLTSCNKEVHAHTFGSWTVSKEPTCLDKGEEEGICSTCGAKTTKSIPSLGHDITDWTYTVKPTCTTPGKEERHCSRCNEKNEERDVEAFGHDYGEYTVVKEPTCTEDGLKKKVCSRCQNEESVTLEKLGHKEVVIKEGKEPTCTEDGWTKEVQCSRCGEVLSPSTALSATGHDYEITYTWSDDLTTCHAKAVCKHNANEIEEETGNTEKTVLTEPTCTKEGKASYKVGFQSPVFTTQTITAPLSALGHERKNLVTTPSNCIEKGKIEYHCDRCDQDFTEELPLTDHTPSTTSEAVEATCTEEGKTANIVCSVCNKVLQKTETIPALGHHFEVLNQTESSCTKGGTITQKCSRCNETKTITLAASAHIDEDKDGFCDNCFYFMKSDTAIKITSSQDLSKIKLNDSDANYILANDITLNGFAPIGDESHTFNGILYGNNHTITLKGYTDMSLCGIFYRIKGRIVSVNINPTEYSTINVDSKAGFLTLYNAGTIKNCKIVGEWKYKFRTSYNYGEKDYFVVSKKNTFEVGELVYTNEANGKILSCITDGKITISSETDSHHYGIATFAHFFTDAEKEVHLYVTMNENFACLAVNNLGTIQDCDVNSPLTHTGTYEIGTNHRALGYGYCTFSVNQSIASVVVDNKGSIKNTLACKFKEPSDKVIYHDNKQDDHTSFNANYQFDTIYRGMITYNTGKAYVTAY